MVRNLVISAAAILLFAACSGSSGSGGNTPQATSIFGVWSKDGSSDGFQYKFLLDIRENSTVISVTCSTNQGSATVSKEVSSKVVGNQYSAEGSPSVKTTQQGVTCELNLPAFDGTFALVGNTLQLTFGGKTESLNYLRDNEFSKPKTKSSPTPPPAPTPTPQPEQTTTPTPTPRPIPTPANSIYGNWGLEQTENEYSISFLFSIGANSTTVSTKCSYQGQTGSASATVSSTVVGNTLKILSGAQASKVGDLDCGLNITPDDLAFSISGNTLTLTSAREPQSLILTRR
ncbi:MAG: hypothetical protein A4S09_12565 [Proteobacteria bacterium SG_bin7]|nr:MAG: hypothetical protein A4S09_12565 [Proteobacteria bacterium SG_bin7]